MTYAEPRFIRVLGHTPQVARSAWVARNAVLAGEVMLGPRSSVWFGAVLRADAEAIRIGQSSNIQDGAIIHTDPGYPTTVGDGVSVGHRAVLHGCTVGDHVLVGMGAIVLNGAHIGEGSLLAAGTVVLEATTIPAGSLVAGVPGRVRRILNEDERDSIGRNAESYAARIDHYR